VTDWLGEELLLSRLGDALGGETVACPSADSVIALRSAVVALHQGRPRRHAGVWTRARLAAAAVIGTTSLGAGVAFAAGVPLPAPVRSLASGLGLPVDSPAVSATRHAEHRLQEDLHAAQSAMSPTSASSASSARPATGPHAPMAAAVIRDANALSHQLAQLAPSDRSRLGTTPVSLLDQAQIMVPSITTPAPATVPRPAVTGGVTTTTTTTVPPVTLPQISIPPITSPVTVPGGARPTIRVQITVPITIPRLQTTP
jgi:hypothetical protein